MVQTWLGASLLSWVGTAAWTAALAWQAVQVLPPAQAGLVIAISTLPQASLSLVGGVLADRYSTRTIMIIGQLANAAVLLAGAALWGTLPALGVLAAVGVAFGITNGLTIPAAATLARQLVSADDLATVAGWNQIGARLARLAGAPLGAILVATVGLPPVMALDAATFAVAATALTFVVRPRYRLHDETPEPWRRSLTAGFTYLARDRAALVFVLGLCGLNVFASPLENLGVPLRITASGWPASVFGMTEAIFSGAAIVGSIAAIRIKPRRETQAAFSLLLIQGVAYAGIAISSQAVLAVSMAVIGLTAGRASVWLAAQFVQVVQPAYLGRVAALSNLGDLLLIPLATPAFGFLTTQVGIDYSPVSLAGLMTAMCAAILSRRDLRALTSAAA